MTDHRRPTPSPKALRDAIAEGLHEKVRAERDQLRADLDRVKGELRAANLRAEQAERAAKLAEERGARDRRDRLDAERRREEADEARAAAEKSMRDNAVEVLDQVKALLRRSGVVGDVL